MEIGVSGLVSAIPNFVFFFFFCVFTLLFFFSLSLRPGTRIGVSSGRGRGPDSSTGKHKSRRRPAAVCASVRGRGVAVRVSASRGGRGRRGGGRVAVVPRPCSAGVFMPERNKYVLYVYLCGPAADRRFPYRIIMIRAPHRLARAIPLDYAVPSTRNRGEKC